jgi:hypothetical protein
MPVPPGSTKARKPTHLKILKGSFRPGRDNALEPKLPPETPIAPEALAEDEKATWQRFADVIGPMRVATKQDFAAFQALVLCQTKIDRLEKRLRDDPESPRPTKAWARTARCGESSPSTRCSRNCTDNFKDGSAGSDSRPATEAV